MDTLLEVSQELRRLHKLEQWQHLVALVVALVIVLWTCWYRVLGRSVLFGIP